MVEERYEGVPILIIYDYAGWSVTLKRRNHHHEGEPDFKPWIEKDGMVLANYAGKYHCYGMLTDRPHLINADVRYTVEKWWNEAIRGEWPDSRLAAFRDRKIAKYEAKKQELQARLDGNRSV